VATIEAQPKYKCCRCVQTPPGPGQPFQPIVLYTYQDALDHVMHVHMATPGAQTKKEKKLNYELELFEQNLEDLLATETGQTTTITVNSLTGKESAITATAASSSLVDFDEAPSDDDPDNGDFCFDEYFDEDLTEWNVILNEPFSCSQAANANVLANNTNQA
jgi:hypothetical protein